jgi:hypothetical protein
VVTIMFFPMIVLSECRAPDFGLFEEIGSRLEAIWRSWLQVDEC